MNCNAAFDWLTLIILKTGFEMSSHVLWLLLCQNTSNADIFYITLMMAGWCYEDARSDLHGNQFYCILLSLILFLCGCKLLRSFRKWLTWESSQTNKQTNTQIADQSNPRIGLCFVLFLGGHARIFWKVRQVAVYITQWFFFSPPGIMP